MGSLEQQMALFEELISQEQAPTNGILVPVVSMAPPGFRQQPAIVVPVSTGIIASTAYRGGIVAGIQPTSHITTVVSRPQPLIVSSAPQIIPSLHNIPLPPSEDGPRPARVHAPSQKEQTEPQSKKQKVTPRLYEKEAGNLELQAAIAKATAAANATNSQRYSLNEIRDGTATIPAPRQTYQAVKAQNPASSMRPSPSMRPGPPPPHIPHMAPPMRTPLNWYHPTPVPKAADVLGQADLAKNASKMKQKFDKKDKRMVRRAAGDTWEDSSLMEWDENDFRIFVGDLGNECNDEMLYRAFSKYASLVKVKVIRDKRSNKTKGYGFASFKESADYVKAMREVNGKYIGNRPCKLRKSTWKDRQLSTVRKKNNEKQRLGLKI